MKRISVLCMFIVLLYVTCFARGQDTLHLGVPLFTEAAKDNFLYFTLPALAQPITGNNKLIFTLTSISGDADMYLSTTNPNPGPRNFERKSSTLGEDLIQINGTDAVKMRTGPWYVGVQAYHVDAYFSIVAYTLDSHITLSDGVPQVAHVSWSEYAYFKYVATGPGTFSVSSTSIFGDPDLYMSDTIEFPDRSHYNQSRLGHGTDLMTITPPASATFPKTYYFAVYGFGSDAYFNIEVTRATTTALLSSGIPLFENIPAGEYMYFKFKLTVEANLTFSVTKKSFFGDPDLYISTTNQRPNATSYQWKGATAFRGEELTIAKGSTGWTKGWYYIGVRSNSALYATEITITVDIGGNHIILTSGNTLPVLESAGKSSYFKSYYQTKRGDHAQYVEFTVSPSDGGEVEVYASSTNQFPSKDNHEYAGTYIMSSNVIHIDFPVQGWYYITVVAKTDVSYSITASQAKLFISLDNGISQSFSIVGGQYRDFVFSADTNDADILLSVHSLSGDADFYVGVNQNVTRNNYIWGSFLANSDVLTISKNDPVRKQPYFNNQFFIAVYGFTDAYFSISAYYANTTIALTDGVPVSGVVQRGQYQYYSYTLTNPGSLTFNLRGMEASSDPDLYVAVEYPNPTREHFQWESWKLGDDFLNIPNAAARTYYIGVYGFAANTTYILSVSADYESLSSFGYSIVDYVAAGQYRYYATYLYPDNVHPMITGITLVSGHTELYVSKNSSKPSRTEYAYSDLTWPGNFLTVPASNVTFGRWMYAVYGVENSYYLIHTSTREIQGALRRGEPKIGFVKKGERAVFKLSYYLGQQDGTYYTYINQITSIPGRIGVYVDQFPNQTPNATNARWKAEGVDDILVTMDGMSTSASIFVSVYAYDQDTRFQIVVAETTEPVYLTEEQPNKVRTKAGEKNYFEVPALPGSTKIDLIASSCSDTLPPTIYGSLTNTKPDANNKDFVSTADGKFRQKASYNKATNHLYYLGTDAPTSEFVFSIYATTTGDQRPVPTGEGKLVVGDLVSTTQQRINIPKANGRLPIRYFMYKRVLKPDEKPEDINMLTVCAIQNPASGSVLLGEIDVPPNIPNTLFYDIPVNDDQRYIINVVAVDSYGLAAPYQQINFNTEKTNVITLGRSLRSSTNGSEYAQLTLKAANVAANDVLTIALTPFTGDVDLYISTTPNPTKDNAIWKGTTGGYDIISIPKSDARWPASGDFYVAVYGVSSGEDYFSIMAYTSQTTQILQDGQPQLAKVDEFKYTYFIFDLEDNSTFTISLTPISGDPDVIASNSIITPTKINADWESSGSSIDLITIRPTDAKYLPYTKYYIGVYGWSAAMYSIVATKEYSNELITEGVPHGGYADKNQYDYFKFKLTSNRSLLITVTSITDNGDPDVYVSTSVERPTYWDSTWKKDRQGQDTLIISSTDPNFKQGWYYIGIRAYRIDCTFTVSVITEDFAYLLADGTVQDFAAIENTYTYFKAFYGFKRNTLTFTVNPVEEDSVQLYCASSTTKPTREKHDFEGQTQGAFIYVSVNPNSNIGWYYCSVYGKRNTNYTISATTNQRPIVLNDGRLDIFNYVEMGYYAYFTFDIDPAARRDVTISTLADFGDPDLYVSYNNTRPTKGHAQFGRENYAGDSLVIRAAQLPETVQRLYIGVYGFTSSRFSIVAFSTNETIELQDATPLPGYAGQNEYKQYQYELTNNGRVKFTLTVLNSFANADLYVDIKPNPNAAQYKYKGELFGNDVVEFDGQARMYYIAVYGGSSGASYSLSASTEYETINVGSYITDYANTNNYRYYRTNIPSIADHVLASITLINGRTEFYANPSEDKPTRSNYTFSSLDYPGNFLYVHNNHPKFASGTWTFAVYAAADSDYFVSVQYKEGNLYNGIPRVGYVTPGDVTEHIYYSYRLPYFGPPTVNVTVNVRPFVNPNSACLRIYVSQNNTRPSAADHTYTAVSEARYGNQIVVNMFGVTSARNLYFGVESCSGKPEKYEISVNNNVDIVYLTQNYASLFSSAASQYTVLASKHSEVLSISLDSCDNNPATAMKLVASTVAHDANPPYIGESLDSPFTVQIMSDSVKGNAKYFIGVTHVRDTAPQLLSIFTTTSYNDPRPKIGKLTPAIVKRQKVGKVNQNIMEVSFNGEKEQAVSVYLHEVTQPIDEKNPASILTKVNMATVCGIRANKNLAVVANVTGADTARFAVDTDKYYIVGAIITDNRYSTERSYSPVVILKGGKVVLPGLKFSVGALFIWFAMIALVSYLIIGISYNLIKGEENGLRVIPFVHVWADLPWLVVDGVKFVIYCGRGTNNYSVFEDDDHGANTFEEPNPFRVSNVDNNKSSSSSGYGAI